MFLWIGLLGLLIAGSALAASLYILAFAIAGLRSSQKNQSLAGAAAEPIFLIFIPAHNEASGISPTIKSALAQEYPRDKFRVITIADNCGDQTARVAAHCGSEVWMRDDLKNRGKGQALAWAFERAKDIPFDQALILDADSILDPQFLRSMAREAAASPFGSVLQGRYEFLPSPSSDAGWFETFTLASKAAENSFIYRPRSAAGLVSLLQGNGFSIPRATLATVPFGAISVVEDAEYAISLAIAGVPVRYVDDAHVLSRMTQGLQDAAPQRLRWASGIFQLIFRAVPRLIGQSLRQRRWKLAEAALMLLLTSRVLIVLATVLSFAFAAITLPKPAGWHILELAIAAAILQFAYLLLMFRKSATTPFAMKGLLFMPAYLAIVSFSQALALTGLRRKRWARTVR